MPAYCLLQNAGNQRSAQASEKRLTRSAVCARITPLQWWGTAIAAVTEGETQSTRTTAVVPGALAWWLGGVGGVGRGIWGC